MAVDATAAGAGSSRRTSFFNDPRVRGILAQVLVFAGLALLVWWIAGNTVDNLRRQNIGSGFDFLNARSGFPIGQSLVEYTPDSTYRDAIFIGFLNTLLVAVCGIITASIVGFLVGIGRLSGNWLLRKICMVYVELFRNLPPLLVIFFLYLAVLAVLPAPRDSVEIGLPLGMQTPFGLIGLDETLGIGAYLNIRGLFIPRIVWGEGAWMVIAGLALGIVLAFVTHRWATKRRMQTGESFPILPVSIALIVGLPLLGLVAAGFPITLDVPVQGNFNLSGGSQVLPEFLALYVALSLYTASFIAEIVRAGIMGVPRGQTEASYALGLQSGRTLRLVVVPQALRIIIPPLTSQYLNLTKNSSLAVAIGYPDLVQIGQTTMNQSGQAIEVVAIWMVIYLTISLVTSILMNWFNARMALVER
ncbi:MAG: amino acid ABC transporter permease [Mesorhizobium amorphae]|nr:MAG: amino acid ABC transporter permease [Mesorhizobium amorphae]